MDLVYEAVGGDMFKVAVDAVATKGRVLVIGMMSQYGAGWPTAQHPGLPEKLLKKSATLQGAGCALVLGAAERRSAITLRIQRFLCTLLDGSVTCNAPTAPWRLCAGLPAHLPGCSRHAARTRCHCACRLLPTALRQQAAATSAKTL